MKKIIILNSFSFNMFPPEAELAEMQVNRCTPQEVAADIAANGGNSAIESYVGHEDMANVVSTQLGYHVPKNRRNLVLPSVEGSVDKPENTELYVAQYTGPRLPEGATELPQGARIAWYWVTFYTGPVCR